jgi:hypothetical protein
VPVEGEKEQAKGRAHERPLERRSAEPQATTPEARVASSGVRTRGQAALMT